MALAPRTRLGPYAITASIGAGGMGEVYKATDTRLDRTVAVKVLPEHVASDPDLKQRFEREAKTLAALSHPHICPIHDVGSQDGIDFLVMEYLDGDTLATRLEKGALPINQALQYAIQITDALDKAHRKGIVHRDLKPGNVMLTKSGVKLLDFGLAKVQPAGVVAGMSVAATMTSPLTAQGTILGTLHYMAPEQVEGKEADARSDIFSCGAIVYEMTTGKRAFEGKSAASVMAAILEREPPMMSTLQPLAPPLLDHIVRRCLGKDPEERWQSAADLMRDLKLIADGAAGVGVTTSAPAGAMRRERIAWISALALMTMIAAVVSMVAFRPAPPAPEMRLEVTTPPTGDPASLAISPDGQRMVFVATSEGRSRLWLRPLDSTSGRALAGTDGASFPFWSPDSQSVGFFADGKLKRLDVDRGFVQILADAPSGRGGAWNRDGTIIFTPNPASSAIFQIAATGGTPSPLTRIDPSKETSHRFPQFLPDGHHFLYYVQGTPESRGIYVGDLDESPARRVLDVDSAPVYAASGHLLFARQGTLFAQAFDVTRLELTGNSFSVVEQVASSSTGQGLAAVSASAAGPILYRTASVGGGRQLVWVDRSGKDVGRVGDPIGAQDLSMSPNGQRVALSHQAINGNVDSWLLDLGRGVLSRLTFDTGNDLFPTWSPDGRRIAFTSNRKGAYDLYWKPVVGPGREELLFANAQDKHPMDWSPDGRFLLYRSLDPKGGNDLWALPLDGDRKPVPVIQTNFDEDLPQFSPDGKWIAYQSNGSGRFEIYIQPFPGPGEQAQVSTTGGAQVRWHRDGTELFYIALDGRLMAVPLHLGSNTQTLEAGSPIPLFTTRAGGALLFPFKHQYVVSSDGQRFLMNTLTDEAAIAPITVILNWKANP
jgi:Tol biopolymer transport system component